MDPVVKRIRGLRALVTVMLVSAAVIVGVGLFFQASYKERHTAVNRFASIVKFATLKLDANFKNMNNALSLLAHTYTDAHPSLADRPAVVLPSFYTSAPLAREIGGSHNVAFFTLVKPIDAPSYESFIFNYWDSEPAIPPGMAGYYGPGERGIWAFNSVNDTGIPYHGETYNFSLRPVFYIYVSPAYSTLSPVPFL
jgi:hypothetical protein